MKVVINPHTSFVPGTVQRILGEIGCGPVLTDLEGKVHAELNALQLDMFRLKGAAHQVTILPDQETTPILDASAATFPEADTTAESELTMIIETAPGVRQTVKIGPSGLEPIAAANTPVAGSQHPVKGSEAKSA